MSGTSATRVLLIEDEPGDAQLVTSLLRVVRYGKFVVHGVDCLSEALRALRDHCFDAALLDLSLPDSTGLETIRSFRRAAPDLPVVVLTGLDDREVGLKALQEGCQDYIVKGNADGETMTRTIVHSIQRKRLEVELLQAKAKLQEAYDDLERRVTERTSQLRRVALEATMAEERERHAIARDLHDDLGQMLHVAGIKLGQLAKPLAEGARLALTAELNDIVADASRMVRSLTSQLSPPTLVELGLLPALSWLADEMSRAYGLKVTVRADGGTVPQLDHAQAAILFRAVRELLINVSKHAATDAATVAVRGGGGKLVLAVADEGAGMADWRTALPEGKGFGLASIRERIAFLGGSMDIRTTPERGTTVTLEMPLSRPAGAAETMEDSP